MVHLAWHRSKAAHLKHQPLQHGDSPYRIPGNELPGFFSQVQQNCTGFEDADGCAIWAIGINDRRDLVVRADPQEIGLELIVLGDINHRDRVVQAHFFQRDRDLAAIGCVKCEKLNRHCMRFLMRL